MAAQDLPPMPTTIPSVDTPPTVPPIQTSGMVVTPKSNNLPRILLIIVLLLLLVAGILVVVKFVIPRFTGGSKQVNLTWWGVWENEATIAPLIAEYTQTHPNVKIQYIQQSKEDYRERLTNALAKGTGPDIFTFHNTWVSMFKGDLDTLPQTVMSAQDFAQTFYPVASSDLAGQAGVVGMPLGFDDISLFINQDIFNTAGKVIPKTWDDLRQTALDLTVRDQNGAIKQAGVALGRTENVDHWQEILALMMLQNGVKLSSPTGEKAEKALQFFTIFSGSDHVWDQSLPPSTSAFASGKLAMYFAPSWRIFEIKNLNPNLKFSVVPVPQLPKDTPSEPDVAYATYWANGVWTRSTGKVDAWDFLKFLSSKESLQKIYENASKVRLYGEPYPRTDMAPLISTDPIIGAFVSQGPFAQSWYLASRTFDGPTGINSQISKYFEDAVNAVNGGNPPTQALQTAATGVSQVLTQYGLISAP